MSSRAELLEAALWIGLMVVTAVAVARSGRRVVHREWGGTEEALGRASFRSCFCEPVARLVDGTWL